MGAFIINQQTKAQRLPEFGELFEQIVEPGRIPTAVAGACGWCLKSGLWPRGRERAPGSSWAERRTDAAESPLRRVCRVVSRGTVSVPLAITAAPEWGQEHGLREAGRVFENLDS